MSLGKLGGAALAILWFAIHIAGDFGGLTGSHFAG